MELRIYPSGEVNSKSLKSRCFYYTLSWLFLCRFRRWLIADLLWELDESSILDRSVLLLLPDVGKAGSVAFFEFVHGDLLLETTFKSFSLSGDVTIRLYDSLFVTDGNSSLLVFSPECISESVFSAALSRIECLLRVDEATSSLRITDSVLERKVPSG